MAPLPTQIKFTGILLTLAPLLRYNLLVYKSVRKKVTFAFKKLPATLFLVGSEARGPEEEKEHSLLRSEDVEEMDSEAEEEVLSSNLELTNKIRQA